MMRIPTYILLMLLLALGTKAQQNLVPNPSFEDTLACPLSNGYISYANYWFTPNTNSSDLIHSCNPFIATGWNSNAMSTPSNHVGFQYPRTGEAYAGIHAINWIDEYNREMLEVGLTDTLEEGKCYEVEFYFSVADTFSSVLVTNIGVRFTNDSLLTWNLQGLSYLDDTTTYTSFNYDDWYHFSAIYTANGGEQFLTIGNFNYFSTTDTIKNNSHNTFWTPANFSYLYIDDVSVTEYACHTAITEQTTPKQLLRIIDVLGRKTKPQTNVPLFYIYDNGTVEKRIVIE
jgi:OOP family OmpA-OmpF porin